MAHPKRFGRELNVSLRMTFPSTNDGAPPAARLEIQDETSLVRIMEIELSGDDLLALMAARGIRTVAAVPADLTRIGKNLVTGQTHFPTWTSGGGSVDAPAAEEQAEEWRKANGWETVRVSRNNKSQWVATGSRWDVIETEEKDA